MLVLVMGVAGSGKTLIGSMLADSLGWRFADADDFHPVANIEKMRQGIPLTDADRGPWLSNMHRSISDWIDSGENVVLACSALKQRYREQLAEGCGMKVVYLKGSFDLIHSRLAGRHNHFMRAELLASQFADLEEPEGAITVDIARAPDQIIAEVRKDLPQSAGIPARR